MTGQWMGRYSGTEGGKVILDIDDYGRYFGGAASATSDIPGLPQLTIRFRTDDKSRKFHLVTNNILAHDLNGDAAPWQQLKASFPANVSVPTQIDVNGEWNEQSLHLSWQTDIGTQGECTLPKTRSESDSELIPLKMTWQEFKEHVSALTARRDLFRGQNLPWRLRTTFHRSGRADLLRYIELDIPKLYRHLTVRTRHKYNLKDADENGAFFNLVQHHGYPTPLLDWSYSPYVAAFFAYRGISGIEARSAGQNDRVRIFVLDERWRIEVQQILIATRPFPHFSIGEFIAIDNERLIPQQSVSALTNVDDIETYLADMGETVGKRQPYLSAIDLPVSERATVIDDLAYMGVTAGSLFPGIDGTCEELKERHFR